MKILELLKERRSIYRINKEIKTDEKAVFNLIKEATRLVPDAFDMKSSRVLVVTGKAQNQLWDNIYDVFEGKVPREKIDGFKSGYGTILYFYDQDVVKDLQEKFELYADRFPTWAIQSSAMLQISIWTGLKELGIGASLQHYNPIINDMVKQMFNLPSNYILDAQMPFGGIVAEAEEKDKEDITKRVKIINK